MGSELPGEELMTRIAKGDDDVFEILVNRHQASVLNLICRFIGDSGSTKSLLTFAYRLTKINIQNILLNHLVSIKEGTIKGNAAKHHINKMVLFIAGFLFWKIEQPSPFSLFEGTAEKAVACDLSKISKLIKPLEVFKDKSN